MKQDKIFGQSRNNLVLKYLAYDSDLVDKINREGSSLSFSPVGGEKMASTRQ